MTANITVKSQRKPSKPCLGRKSRRFYDHEPWFLVKSMELAYNSETSLSVKIKGTNVSTVREWHLFLLLKGFSRTIQDSLG